MKKILSWLKNEESGQGMVEYGLIIVGIALVVVAAFVVLSGNLTNLFNKIGNALQGS